MWCIGGRLASPTGLRVLLIVALPRADVRPMAGLGRGAFEPHQSRVAWEFSPKRVVNSI
ncbi:hypothetical protein DPMN_176678 [Dreissena polymorpha]|uniref:Uncharacterized protein n=1 Tax=Dreissena polymorpha TaxID=45954 RepID=A0A9D4EBS9_DREPO|nr:hypothetical protein DPMN_176678 [Dreissena polymorpha]